MADISKIKLANGTTVDIKDAKAREDLATEVTRATGAEGLLSTAISAEETRAKGIEGGLDTRISNLEARGRFLSNWNATTGLPTTYPDIPSSATTTYTYTFKSGDYYIVGTVPASGTKYAPSGSSITATKSGDTWTWEIGKAETAETLSAGDQYVYDGSKWTHIAAAKDVAWGTITGTLADQTDLKNALDVKVPETREIAGVDLKDNITTEEMQTALGLEDLAYADTASGSFTPAGTIGEIDATPAGSVSVTVSNTSTAATIATKADYTPAGSVSGTVIPTGTVSLNAFTQTSTDITSTGKFTPAGTIAAATEGGSFSALKTASFAETSTGGVQIGGTVSAPTITVDDDTVDTFVKSLKAGDTDAASIDTSKFSGGSFTGASAASFTQGAKASFIQGAKASFSKGTAVAATTEGIVAAVGTGDDAETLIFTTAATDNVIGHDEATFTANGDDTFTANGDDTFTANTVGTFTPAAINTGFFSAQKLPVVDGTASAVTAVSATASAPTFTGKSYIVNTTDDTALKSVVFTGTEGNVSVGGKYDKATANGATFTGNASGDAITATFAGTKAEQLIPTAINYEKATSATGSFTGTTHKITPVFTGTAGTVTVTPDAV